MEQNGQIVPSISSRNIQRKRCTMSFCYVFCKVKRCFPHFPQKTSLHISCPFLNHCASTLLSPETINSELVKGLILFIRLFILLSCLCSSKMTTFHVTFHKKEEYLEFFILLLNLFIILNEYLV